MAIRAAWLGFVLVADTAMMLVWPTVETDTSGAVPSWARTASLMGLLVTNDCSVRTSVLVSVESERPFGASGTGVLDGWIRICALAV